MASLLRFMRKSFRKAPLLPLRFPSAGFPVVRDSCLLEEEQLDEFRAGQYYPANIGDVYDEKYQVLGKLGFGSTSTVWLARNLLEHNYVALKIYTRDGGHQDEFAIYDALGKGNRSHPGYSHKPMWDSWRDVVRWNPTGLFSEDLLKSGLAKLFLALDYLHTECNIVHTDIKADNIMLELVDESVLGAFVQSEMDDPSPRKFVNGVPIYLSRQFGRPKKFGDVILGDFGAAVRGDVKRNHDAQPNVYRSPEVMLKTEWSYAVDIWNVGAMIWDLFEGKHLFYGNDPKEDRYLTRAHLAELVAILGPLPLDLLQRGKRSGEFFAEDGKWKAEIPIPHQRIEDTITRLEGEKKEAFLTFVKGLLQWRPEDRKTASQLYEDPWLRG